MCAASYEREYVATEEHFSNANAAVEVCSEKEKREKNSGGALVWHTAEECVFVGVSVIDFEPGFCSTGETAVVLVKTNIEGRI